MASTRVEARSVLIVSSILFAIVWVFPAILGVQAILDPVGTWTEGPFGAPASANEENSLRLLGPILGVGLLVLSLLGAIVAVAPTIRGVRWAFAFAAVSSFLVVLMALVLHGMGAWDAYPFWLPSLVWLLGLASGVVGLRLVGRVGGIGRGPRTVG